jgi:hypothetical protein
MTEVGQTTSISLLPTFNFPLPNSHKLELLIE